MAQSTTEQHCSLGSRGCPDEGVDLKLLLNSQPQRQAAWTCCRLKAFFARLGALVAFHLLNVLLAISGAGLVLALTVLSVALLPALLVAFLIVLWVEDTTERFPNWNCLILMGVPLAIIFTVIYTIGCVACMCVVFGVLGVLLLGPPIQRHFVILDAIAVNVLALLDVKLANFVVPSIPLKTKPRAAIRRDPTKLPDAAYDCTICLWLGERLVLDVFTTLEMWSAVLYFLLPKLLVGVLSFITVMLAMVLPFLVLAINGQVPWIASRHTFQDDPVVYVSATVMLWLLGVLGIILVPVCSVRLTAWGCGEYEREQQEQYVQEEHNTTRTSSSEATAVSFVELKD